MSNKTTVDLITQRADGSFCMVLLETSPWADDYMDHLNSLQDRMFDCVDIAIDGKLAQKYPESKGEEVLILLDCYGIPQDAVDEYFNRFQAYIRSDEGVLGDLENNAYISGISFEIYHHTLGQRGILGSGVGEQLDSEITFGNDYD